MSLPFTAQAQWIWSAEGSHAAPAPADASPSNYQVRLFRRTLEAARPGDLPARIHVSADSRYVLWCNGVMVGRAAYHDPAAVLIGADSLWGEDFAPDAHQVVQSMLPYIAAHLAQGGRLHQITRHMLGLFTGRPGARGWRRVLSEGANRPGAGTDLLLHALDQVPRADLSAA